MKLSELLRGRHSKGVYFSCFIPRIVVGVSHCCYLVAGFFRFPKVIFYSRVRFAVVFIGSTLFALQQLSGINAVFYFSSTVFKSAGVPSDIANVCIGIANLAGMDTCAQVINPNLLSYSIL